MSPTLHRLWLLLRTWLAWWLRELRGLVPARLAEALAGERDLLVIDIEPTRLIVRQRAGAQLTALADVAFPEGGTPARPPALTRALTHGHPAAIVRLAPTVAVRKLVPLPDGAAADLRAVLEHQLERHTPIDPEQLYFDHAVHGHDTTQKRLSVELVMVLRPTVDAVDRLVRSWGLVPRAIGLIEPGTWRTRFNFAPREAAAIARTTRRRLALAGLAASLLVIAAYASLRHAQRHADALEVMVAEARGQAQAASRLRAEIARRIEQRDFLVTKRLEASRLQVMTDLARTLGDDTWLTDLQLSGAKLRVGGYAQAASSLIPLLQQQPGFANPRFESPVTRATTGTGERFDLSVELAAPARGARP